jgi:hypothetical protein
MTLNKKLTTTLGYEIYGKDKEANFGRALLEFIGIMAIVGLLYVYLITLN